MAAARSSVCVTLWPALDAIGEARGRRQLLKIANECGATRGYRDVYDLERRMRQLDRRRVTFTNAYVSMASSR